MPQILNILRQQSLFNTLIASCVRGSSNRAGSYALILILDTDHSLNKCDVLRFTEPGNSIVVEIRSLSCEQLSIALEQPFKQVMATVELDLSNMRNITCEIYAMNSDYSAFAGDLTRVLQRCVSVPVTVRTLIKYWEREDLNKVANELEEINRLLGDDIFDSTGVEADESMGQDFTDSKQSLYPLSGDDRMDCVDGEGKALKKRRTDDFDVFKRNDAIAKDDKKDSSNRPVSKESEFKLDLKILYRQFQRKNLNI